MKDFKVYTSYYGKFKKLIENNVVPVCISRGVPKYLSPGDRNKLEMFQDLAPYSWMLNKSVTQEAYDIAFGKILDELDPDEVYNKLEQISTKNEGKDVALLCYEKDHTTCHRNKVAEWLIENNYEVEEFQEQEKISKNPTVEQGSLF